VVVQPIDDKISIIGYEETFVGTGMYEPTSMRFAGCLYSWKQKPNLVLAMRRAIVGKSLKGAKSAKKPGRSRDL
jgi:hypothetical protein